MPNTSPPETLRFHAWNTTAANRRGSAIFNQSEKLVEPPRGLDCARLSVRPSPGSRGTKLPEPLNRYQLPRMIIQYSPSLSKWTARRNATLCDCCSAETRKLSQEDLMKQHRSSVERSIQS